MKPEEIARKRTAIVRQLVGLKGAIERDCPPGRQRSLALTHLEGALVHAAASLEGVESLFDLKEVSS